MRHFGLRRRPGIWLILANSMSGMLALWSSRAFHFNAYNTGWGDIAAEREQYLLGWFRIVSLLVLLIAVGASSVFSTRYRWSILGGAAFAGAALWMSGMSGTRYFGYLLLPGWFAQASFFGVHADVSPFTTPFFWMLGTNVALYASLVALALTLANRPMISANNKLGASS